MLTMQWRSARRSNHSVVDMLSSAAKLYVRQNVANRKAFALVGTVGVRIVRGLNTPLEGPTDQEPVGAQLGAGPSYTAACVTLAIVAWGQTDSGRAGLRVNNGRNIRASIRRIGSRRIAR
jgi:hypothetical protein